MLTIPFYGAGRPKRTPVRDSKFNALYNQGQEYLPRNIYYKVLSSSYDDSRVILIYFAHCGLYSVSIILVQKACPLYNTNNEHFSFTSTTLIISTCPHHQ